MAHFSRHQAQRDFALPETPDDDDGARILRLGGGPDDRFLGPSGPTCAADTPDCVFIAMSAESADTG